ncbi:zeta toxin family protein [Ophiostoma piceae UAMH 11346]|uniref:Zeta toxin family protein n=1 Tax=Ophiostoma piceae (strain UAMH 11346) TaxID=1262450 RepID=S3BPS0_OPHP1|nr:zeta toxin family protein [Ophiostoma piceae UAMH 11346]
MPRPSDYFLSEDDNAAIFEQQIRPAGFGRFGDGTVPADARPKDAAPDRPVCIILAGQTGAGKSHAAPALAAALHKAYVGVSATDSQRYCHLVADTHKPYHPAYAGLVADAAAGKAPPGLASAATGFDARRWLSRACAVAAGAPASQTGPGTPPLPTLIESASRYPQDVVEMAGIFRRAGFHVCIVLLAVHAAQSRLGLLARYLDALSAAEAQPAETETEAGTDKKKKLPVRLTPRPIHDESYAGLAELASVLDKESDGDSSLADEVLILRRGNQVAYANCYGEDGRNKWKTSPPRVSRALAAERARQGVAAESALLFSDVARLKERHPERAAELDAFAAEYEADMAVKEEGETQNLGELYALDPDALVAHLRSEW